MRVAQGEGPANLENRIPTTGVHTPWAMYRQDLHVKMGQAYQQGENAAVRFWGRKVYGVWPKSFQQGCRESFPTLSALKFTERIDGHENF